MDRVGCKQRVIYGTCKRTGVSQGVLKGEKRIFKKLTLKVLFQRVLIFLLSFGAFCGGRLGMLDGAIGCEIDAAYNGRSRDNNGVDCFSRMQRISKATNKRKLLKLKWVNSNYVRRIGDFKKFMYCGWCVMLYRCPKSIN